MVVEMFLKNRRVASHVRSRKKYGYTTLIEHMPDSHKHYAEWSVERLVAWAQEAGGQTAIVITRIIDSRPVPQQGFKPCLGIMNLGKSYGMARLEAACNRALAFNAINYKSIHSILKTGLDSQPVPDQEGYQLELAIDHENIRGPEYFQATKKGEI
jgi:transposase